MMEDMVPSLKKLILGDYNSVKVVLVPGKHRFYQGSKAYYKGLKFSIAGDTITLQRILQ